MRCSRILVGTWLLSLSLAAFGLGQANGKAPITKKGLLDALRIGGLSTGELVQIVEQRGVDFQASSADEKELRQAGAHPELIAAVRKNYRTSAPPPAAPAATSPLSKSEILTLLQVGTPSARVEQLVSARGVSFAATPAVAGEIEAAGGSASLVALVNRLGHGAAPAPPPRHVGTAAIQSIRDVRKIFVEKMPDGLDAYLRAEIGEQLKGRLIVALAREDADAIMKGTTTDNRSSIVSVVDRSDRLVLWSSEAGDRTLLGPIKRGGPRKVADRIVHKLKEALK